MLNAREQSGGSHIFIRKFVNISSSLFKPYMDVEAPYKVKNVRGNTFGNDMALKHIISRKVFPLMSQYYIRVVPIPFKSKD